MRITLRQLQIFEAVASSGSTTAASEQLALSQSATSAALNELENLLSATLFDRVGRKLIINDNGRALLGHAKQMLSMARTIEGQFNGEQGVSRDLIIGASTTIGTYILPALLARYRSRYGEVIPRITIANTADVATAVANFDVEIGFIEGPCHVRGLRIEPWIKDELIVVAAPEHEPGSRKSRQKATPSTLAKAKWLLRESGSGTREAVEDALLPHLHYITEGGVFSSSEAIKHACMAGLGLACLSRLVVADLLAQGRLVEVGTTLPRMSRNLYMIYSAGKTLSKPLTEFRNFCRVWQ
ncbi:LysR family transcriptional regulator [Noviherbaspirillum cavernae]|uniref:LysR family transcriptional regulator n=1 Tax=Noviherbaspirillum cavernae TaxID=2320862 RepID=A0A418WY50_9BURK|nr:LysR family transcriptional regulator [Noviherbaspirillum cavernae]RJG05146.1 LysR family transcriptional regulator [Noviherbaspirillum cavernae]